MLTTKDSKAATPLLLAWLLTLAFYFSINIIIKSQKYLYST